MPKQFPVLRHVPSNKDQRVGRSPLRRQKTRTVAPIGYTHKRVRQREVFGGTVRMLILALDYKGSGHDLTCTVDGDNMQALARDCGVQDVTVAYNEQCTPAKVRELIQAIGSRCQPHDTFILNFSGHGTSVTDTDGDEEDNQDEAYVLVDETGRINLESALMTDDELSEQIAACIPKTTKILVISDCCHSGSIMDFAKPSWRGRKAISISGCRDAQTSGDTGNGGICTHAILLAVESLQRKGQTRYSVGKLFNETLRKDDEVFDSPQDITIDSCMGVMQTEIDWPLVPKSQYTAPHNGGGAGPQDGPAPSNAYTVHSSVLQATPVPTYTNGASVAVPVPTYTTAAPAIYTNGSSVVAAPATYTSASYVVSGSSCVTSPGAHAPQSVPGNYYHLPRISQSSVSILPAHTVSQPVYPGPVPVPVATQVANLGHTAYVTPVPVPVATHGRVPQMVTNFAPVNSGSVPLNTGASIEVSAPLLNT
jgi:hypothetical protein